jgi:hypothetical protein
MTKRMTKHRKKRHSLTASEARRFRELAGVGVTGKELSQIFSIDRKGSYALLKNLGLAKRSLTIYDKFAVSLEEMFGPTFLAAYAPIIVTGIVSRCEPLCSAPAQVRSEASRELCRAIRRRNPEPQPETAKWLN